MRFILPQFATPIVRTFEVANQRRVGLGVISGWRLDGSPVHVADLWRELAEELPPETPLDQGIPKSRGELVVTGVGFPTSDPAVVHVRACVGAIDKTLYAVGDRRWVDGVPTDPAPFERMPLGWDRAFGGEGFEANPHGRGHDGVSLPNVERPGQLVRSPSERPTPAGMGPIEVTRAARMQHFGTYDARWLESAYPGFAEDTDWRLFQLAPPDQWLDGMWAGDEAMLLLNLHPERPRIEARLPGVGARAFVQRRGTDKLEEVTLRLSTVWLVPHRELVVLVHHGSADTSESDGADLSRLLVGLEGLGAPRDANHYEAVLERRLDPEWGALASLDDTGLMPEGITLPGLGEPDGTSLRDGRIGENLKRRSMLSQQELRDELEAAGVEPRPMPSVSDDAREPVDLQTLPARIAELKREAQAEREASAVRVAQLREEVGREEVGREEPPTLTGGPPLMVGTLLRERLSALIDEGRRLGKPVEALEAQLEDPRFRAQLEAQDQALREGYRRSAHHAAAAEARDADEAARLRALVVAASEGRASLESVDLTGADLSNLDLKGAALAGAWLEGANLQCADLRGADLSHAVLARADLSDAKLDGTNLRGANLGQARLLYATASGANLSDAVLHQADLRGASLPGCTLRGADLSQARFEQTDLSGADAEGLVLLKSSLVGVTLARASLKRANLLEIDLRGVDLSGADLEQAVLLGCDASESVFRGARLRNVRLVSGCALDRADLSGADLSEANLRGVSAVGACFARATLEGADLSEIGAASASFYRASAKRARFVKADLTGARLVAANLMEALMTEATLHGTDLRGTNLFAADLWDALGDAETSLEHALTTRARFRRELRS